MVTTTTPEAQATLPRVTVFVPTYNEQDAIIACLERIVAQDYPAELMEVLVVDGRSEDRTVSEITRYVDQLMARTDRSLPDIRVMENPDRDLASAWNLAADAATGEFIGLVVAHSLLGPDFLRRSVSRLQANEADVVGGPYRMVGAGMMGQAIAAAMSSPFGVGLSRCRWGGDVPNIDSLANAVYPLDLLRRFLPFDKAIGKGEDWDLHYRMRRENVRLAQYTDIEFEFHARSSLTRLWLQEASYAMAKVNILRKHGAKAVRATHFAPLLFVLWILLGGVAAVPLVGFRPIWGAVLGVYIVCNLVASVAAAAKHGLRLLPLLPLTFLCMHVSYGLGMSLGFLQKPRPRPIDQNA